MSKIRMIFMSGAASGILALAGAYSINPATATSAPPAKNPAPQEEILLTGVVRDFKEWSVAGGHPDFERKPDNGFAHYAGNVRPTLDDDGQIVWVGGGHKITSQWRDSSHRQICPDLYDSSRGDVEGAWGVESTGGVQSAASFKQWFRDVPGVNLSAPLTLRFVRTADGSYVFDDKTDPEYASLGGFFPIDNQLFGNSPGSPKHNYHFTFELRTQFRYDASANQIFKFTGDDDVFVYINGRLVIDLGGVHAAHDQFVDLNRLGLVDGETYRLDFFFAERHRTQSNFRIQTNLMLSTPTMTPTINSSFD